MLIAAGALAERDPYLARLECTIKESAASLQHQEEARLLKAYETWRVLHRVRKRVDRGRESN